MIFFNFNNSSRHPEQTYGIAFTCTFLQVAMVTYAGTATLEWCFNDPETSSEGALNVAIDDLQLHDNGFNNIVEAIEKALECMGFPILPMSR